MIDLNEYLAAFPGPMTSDKIGETEFNKILLNGMSNGRSKQSYVQVFDCKNITFQKICKYFLTHGNS